MEISVDGLWTFVIFLAGLGFFVGTLLFTLRRGEWRHDPSLARVVAIVPLEATFDLEVPGREGGALCFRFTIDADTDFDFDLVITGDVESAEGVVPFACRTSDESRVAGAASMPKITTYPRMHRTGGSLKLASLPQAPCRVQGKVEEGVPGLFKGGAVYVPWNDRRSALERRSNRTCPGCSEPLLGRRHWLGLWRRLPSCCQKCGARLAYDTVGGVYVVERPVDPERDEDGAS